MAGSNVNLVPELHEDGDGHNPANVVTIYTQLTTHIVRTPFIWLVSESVTLPGRERHANGY